MYRIFRSCRYGSLIDLLLRSGKTSVNNCNNVTMYFCPSAVKVNLDHL